MALVLNTTRTGSAFVAYVTYLQDSYLAWSYTRKTRKALMALDARGLEDIGLNRADIDMMSFTRRG
jgi:uncharacterized protein YjiS (DUF1127 family)